MTNWLIAAQDNGGGEVFAFAETIPLPQLESDPFSLVAATNLIPSGLELSPQTLELRWTSFGELDPDVPDNDNDGLSGCFSVSGVEPSGDYGGDVFTYGSEPGTTGAATPCSASPTI